MHFFYIYIEISMYVDVHPSLRKSSFRTNEIYS